MYNCYFRSFLNYSYFCSLLTESAVQRMIRDNWSANKSVKQYEEILHPIRFFSLLGIH